jgi:hypothetical protein
MKTMLQYLQVECIPSTEQPQCTSNKGEGHLVGFLAGRAAQRSTSTHQRWTSDIKGVTHFKPHPTKSPHGSLIESLASHSFLIKARKRERGLRGAHIAAAE